VLSRRAVLEEERSSIREVTLAKLEEGQIVEGTIKNVTDYGAFVDMGGVDGLLHVSDLSWGRVGKPSDVLKPGQHVTAKVLKYDRTKGKISLGVKQTITDDGKNPNVGYGKKILDTYKKNFEEQMKTDKKMFEDAGINVEWIIQEAELQVPDLSANQVKKPNKK
jgi:ribosomal protein S1